MTDRAGLFVARVAALKSIPEGVTTWEIMNSYNELVTEARALVSVIAFDAPRDYGDEASGC